MSKKWLLIGLGAILFLAPITNAQELDPAEVQGKLEGHEERISVLESDVAGLKKLKVSGYIQARYEIHQDSENEADLSGNSKNKDYFYIRRGRLKVTYETTTSSYTIQVDASRDKLSLKDAIAKFKFQLGKTQISIQMGQFNWPFSYDLLRSSSLRELPERARAIRTLMPGERDRGFQLGIIPNSFLELNLGLFNGYGIEDKNYPVITPTKNPALVGRLTADLGILALGVSGFLGKNALLSQPDPAKGITPYELKDKNRFGGDAQFYYQLPVLGGGRLSLEAITGKDFNSTKNDYAQSLGWYLQITQNILDKDQVALRYDIWDPDIGAENDAINTLGLALIHYFDGNMRLTLAYEMPKHQDPKKEKADNFLTVQLQVRF